MDFNSKILKSEIVPFDIESIQSKSIFILDNYADNVFLDLKLLDDKGAIITTNFYWLSNKKDVFDWDKTFWGNTPIKEYADYNKLHDLPKSNINAFVSTKSLTSSTELSVQIQNTTSKVAFFVNLNILDKFGKTIFPVFWNENFVSILPNEKRTIKCIIPNNVKNSKKNLIISGWNIKTQDINF